jgi:hypothetical protein
MLETASHGACPVTPCEWFRMDDLNKYLGLTIESILILAFYCPMNEVKEDVPFYSILSKSCTSHLQSSEWLVNIKVLKRALAELCKT